MAGLFPHLLAGCILFVIGRYAFRSFFEAEKELTRQLLLAFICLFFSITPDIFLGTYYSTHILSVDTLMPYQVFAHFVLIPVAIAVLVLLTLRFDPKRKPLWLMGISALALHFIMDLFLQEAGLFL